MYNEKVMEIFKNPHNVGEMKDANAIGQVGNVSCGDIMKIYLKINENEVIEDASFKTFGCAAAIVSSSIATDLIKGMTIKEALEFDNDKIIEVAGELPVHKIHCSVLAKEAIEDAIKNYYKRKAKEEKQAKAGKLPAKNTKKAEPKKTEKVVKEEKVVENNPASALAKLKETKNAKKVEVKEEVKATSTEQTMETKNLLSSLKIAKINKQLETKSSKPTKQEAKAQKKEEKQAKKNKVAKEKSAKKVDKNFKNLNERLNKLNLK